MHRCNGARDEEATERQKIKLGRLEDTIRQIHICIFLLPTGWSTFLFSRFHAATPGSSCIAVGSPLTSSFCSSADNSTCPTSRRVSRPVTDPSSKSILRKKKADRKKQEGKRGSSPATKLPGTGQIQLSFRITIYNRVRETDRILAYENMSGRTCGDTAGKRLGDSPAGRSGLIKRCTGATRDRESAVSPRAIVSGDLCHSTEWLSASLAATVVAETTNENKMYGREKGKERRFAIAGDFGEDAQSGKDGKRRGETERTTRHHATVNKVINGDRVN